MISQSLSLPMTTPTAPIACACFRGGMLVLPFPGKQTFARARALVADFTIAPECARRPPRRPAGPQCIDSARRCLKIIGA